MKAAFFWGAGAVLEAIVYRERRRRPRRPGEAAAKLQCIRSESVADASRIAAHGASLAPRANGARTRSSEVDIEVGIKVGIEVGIKVGIEVGIKVGIKVIWTRRTGPSTSTPRRRPAPRP